MEGRRWGLTGTALKILAILCMTVDHFAAVFLTVPSLRSTYIAMRIIGRQAFPIFCFMIAEGDAHTRSREKYMARLLAFALISEVPFDLAFHGTPWYPGSQNVFWTLLLGELILWAFSRIRVSEQGGMAGTLPGGFSALGAVAALAVLLLGMAAADRLGTDYGGVGVLLIVLFSLARGYGIAGLLVTAGMMAVCWCGNQLQLTALFVVCLLLPWYSGKRGRDMGRYSFYLYYPLHLLIFAGIALLCF